MQIYENFSMKTSKVLNPQLNDCETMWQILEDKLFVGEKLFVPLVRTFKPIDTRWKRPISVDLRNNIIAGFLVL